MAAVSGTSIFAGRVYGENVARSVGKNLDLKSADSERSNYQDREVVVRIDDGNCGTTCVASVDRKDLDVGAADDCQASSKCGDGEGGRRSGCGLDRFEIAQRSFRRWRRSEPLDERMSERNASFERVAQCALMHTALPLGRAD